MNTIAMPMMRLFVLICIVGSLAACTTSGPAKTEPALRSSSSPPSEITKGKYRVTVPAGWRGDKVLREDATFNLISSSEDAASVIFIEKRADFAEELSVFDYADLVLKQMEGKMAHFRKVNENRFRALGSEAYVVELTGDVQSFRLAYQVSFLRTDTDYIQILAWSTASRFDEKKRVLEAIRDSFAIVK